MPEVRGFQRAKAQMEKVWDALDSGKPDHDTVRDRIASVMAYAQMVRAEVAEQAFQNRAGKEVKQIPKS